jgi:hypothetical protein
MEFLDINVTKDSQSLLLADFIENHILCTLVLKIHAKQENSILFMNSKK